MTLRALQILTKKKTTWRTLLSRRGYTLIETLLALGMMAVGIVVFSSAFLIVTNSSFFIQESVTRDELFRTIKNAIADRRAFQVTSVNNPFVNALVTDDYSATGPILTNQFYDISIYDAAGLRIAGTTLNPVYYRVDGSICPATLTFGLGDCLISATASFMVEGIADWSSFHRMSSVISLPVTGYPLGSPTMRPELFLVNFVIKFFPKQGVVDKKPAKGSVFLNVRDLGF
jgi:hypothetical protein